MEQYFIIWQPIQCCPQHKVDINSYKVDINSTVAQSECMWSLCVEVQRLTEASSQQVVYIIIDKMQKETTNHCKKQKKEHHGELVLFRRSVLCVFDPQEF